MNRILQVALFALLSVFLLSSCVTNEPDSYEAALMRQDQKLKKRVEKSKQRSESWSQRWENYSRRQDEKYDSWIDGVMD